MILLERVVHRFLFASDGSTLDVRALEGIGAAAALQQLIGVAGNYIPGVPPIQHSARVDLHKRLWRVAQRGIDTYVTSKGFGDDGEVEAVKTFPRKERGFHLHELTSAQGKVEAKRLRRMLATAAKGGSFAGDLPTVARFGKKNWLLDGNHRAMVHYIEHGDHKAFHVSFLDLSRSGIYEGVIK